MKSIPVTNIFLMKLLSGQVSLQTSPLEVTSKQQQGTNLWSSDQNKLLINTTPTFENWEVNVFDLLTIEQVDRREETEEKQVVMYSESEVI